MSITPADSSHAPHAFIFDLDGVLVHSMPLHVEAWRLYLDRAGVPVDDIEEAMHGKRNSELVRKWFGDKLTEDVVLGHGAAKERLWRELVIEQGIEKFRILGIEEFLERHRHVPMAVGSNAELENIDFVLDRFNLRQYFRAVVNGYQVEHAKPAPDIYLKCAQELDVPPARCIVFEDSPVGIAAARAAGMRVVGLETTVDELTDVDYRAKDFRNAGLDSWLKTQLA